MTNKDFFDMLIERSKDSRFRKCKSCRGWHHNFDCLIPLCLYATEVFLFLTGADKSCGGEKTHMPNAKVLSEKQAIVEALVERIQGASAGIFVDYQGITVAEDTALRTEMRKENVDYTVVKNTLTRIAIDKVGMNDLDSVLNGSTSLATSSEDPIAPFRIVADYSKKLGDKFNVKAAFMEGKILSEQEIAALSTLTSKNDLYGQLAGTLNSIIAGLAVCLGEVVEKMGGAAAPAEAAE